ncbi:hypothetical protein MMC25_004862 [Agyrium rufum]|nr:hypothetical protein [Agyrium rufum]
MLRRAFKDAIFHVLTNVLLSVVVLYGVGTIAATLLQCQPLAYAWDKSLDGECIDIELFWTINAWFTIVFDSIVLILPWYYVYHLSIARRQKVLLGLAFSVGIVVVTTSIMRYTSLHSASNASDQTVGTLKSTTYTTAECSVALICACLPVLKRSFGALMQALDPVIEPFSGMVIAPVSRAYIRSVHFGGDMLRRSTRDVPDLELQAGGSSSKDSIVTTGQYAEITPRTSLWRTAS